MKARKAKRYRRSDGAVIRKVLAGNVIAAFRDESYTQIARWVDELLKDPEVRRKIEYHTREILKAIAARL